MNTTKKVVIALAAIVFALVISPAIPYSEAGDTRKVATSMENHSTQNTIKTVMIIGGEDSQFVPSVTHLKKGDSIRFINQDGRNGGIAHQIISVDENGTPNGKFNATFQNVGDTYTKKFAEPGIYIYIDSTYPQMQGTLVVA